MIAVAGKPDLETSSGIPKNSRKHAQYEEKPEKMKTFLCILTLGLTPLMCPLGLHAQDWEILKNCRLVPHNSNDGDSFRGSIEEKFIFFGFTWSTRRRIG